MLLRFVKTMVRRYAAALQERQALAQRLRRETGGRPEAARDRGEKLLRGYLTPEQRETYCRQGRFVVRGQSGRRYSIEASDPRFCNVSELDADGQIISRLCAQAAVNIPIADHLLTQKLMLEHHEAEFRRIANRQLFAL